MPAIRDKQYKTQSWEVVKTLEEKHSDKERKLLFSTF